MFYFSIKQKQKVMQGNWKGNNLNNCKAMSLCTGVDGCRLSTLRPFQDHDIISITLFICLNFNFNFHFNFKYHLWNSIFLQTNKLINFLQISSVLYMAKCQSQAFLASMLYAIWSNQKKNNWTKSFIILQCVISLYCTKLNFATILGSRIFWWRSWMCKNDL